MTLQQNNLVDNSSKRGILFLVDLAGSESVAKTGAEGKTLNEAKKINKSLSALTGVINALTDKKSTFVPYRDSKLTRILQESLGGNSKTCLIITCSPSTYCENETLANLRFGYRAKSIKNEPKINKEMNVQEMKQLVSKLEKMLEEKNSKIKELNDYYLENQRSEDFYSEKGVFPLAFRKENSINKEQADLTLTTEQTLLQEIQMLKLNLEEKKKDHEQVNRKFLQTIFTLDEKIKTIDSLCSEKSELLDSLEFANEKIRLLDEKVLQLENLKANSEKDLKDAERRNEILEIDVQNLKESFVRSSSENSTLSKRCIHLTEKLQRLKQDKKDTPIRGNSSEIDADSQAVGVEGLIKLLDKEKALSLELKSIIGNLEVKTTFLEKKNMELESKLTSLSENNARLDQEKMFLREKFSELQKTNTQLSEELKILGEKLRETTLSNERLETGKKEYLEELKNLKIQLQTTEEKLDNQNIKYIKMIQKKTDLKGKLTLFEKLLKEKDQVNNDLQNSKQIMLENLEGMKEQYLMVQKQNEVLAIRENEASNRSSTNEKIILDKEREIKEMQKSITEFRRQLNMIYSEKVEMQNQIEILSTKYLEADSMIEEKDRLIKELEGQKVIKDAEIERLNKLIENEHSNKKRQSEYERRESSQRDSFLERLEQIIKSFDTKFIKNDLEILQILIKQCQPVDSKTERHPMVICEKIIENLADKVKSNLRLSESLKTDENLLGGDQPKCFDQEYSDIEEAEDFEDFDILENINFISDRMKKWQKTIDKGVESTPLSDEENLRQALLATEQMDAEKNRIMAQMAGRIAEMELRINIYEQANSNKINEIALSKGQSEIPEAQPKINEFVEIKHSIETLTEELRGFKSMRDTAANESSPLKELIGKIDKICETVTLANNNPNESKDTQLINKEESSEYYQYVLDTMKNNYDIMQEESNLVKVHHRRLQNLIERKNNELQQGYENHTNLKDEDMKNYLDQLRLLNKGRSRTESINIEAAIIKNQTKIRRERRDEAFSSFNSLEFPEGKHVAFLGSEKKKK